MVEMTKSNMNLGEEKQALVATPQSLLLLHHQDAKSFQTKREIFLEAYHFNLILFVAQNVIYYP
jgi:hypothetical protein